jgi:hypothetical protein
MWITHSYLGTTLGRMRCLFFLLYEDYIEAQTQFARELDYVLERFARELGHSGAVVRPFIGDIEKTRSHVLDKPWGDREREELSQTPSLLMINVDFDVFNPQEHPWFLFHFGRQMVRRIGGDELYRFHEIFQQLAEAVNNADVDPFEVARATYYEIRISDAVKIFEVRPGIFGFSVDLLRAVEFLTRLWRRFAQR